MREKFRVEFLEEAAEFIDALEPKAREKIIFNIRKAQVLNDSELFKKLTDDIWEFRTLFNKTHYRLFAFWDKTKTTDTIVISTHGIMKKTPKTPLADLQRAENARTEYFKQKSKKK